MKKTTKLLKEVRNEYRVRYEAGDLDPTFKDYTPPANELSYYDAMDSNANRQQVAGMRIEVSQVAGTTYSVKVYINQGGAFLSSHVVYDNPSLTISNLEELSLQSHWGSGVAFSDLDIT